MTNKIRECEDNIKSISLYRLDNVIEISGKWYIYLVKENIKAFLVSKLQHITRRLRVNEEEYLIKFKEFCGIDEKSYSYSQHIISSLNPSRSTEGDNGVSNFLELSGNNDILKKRDEEINCLVTSINELSSIFKDLSFLVYEQGNNHIKRRNNIR